MGHNNSAARQTSGKLVTARRYRMQEWYRSHGFTLSIPLPLVSDKEFRRRQELDQALFYRPATSEVSYEILMQVLGQGKQWTVADNNERKKIKWEPTQTGYWLWAEVAQDCPRLGTSWNTLTKEQGLNLLSLEEDAIVWHAHKADTNIMLDRRTWSWLRTSYGRSTLLVCGHAGGIYLSWWSQSILTYSDEHMGGRLAEVIKT